MHLRFIAILTFTAILVIALGFHLSRVEPITAQTTLPTRMIQVDTTTIIVEVASTAQERKLGLSGRSALSEGSGMLFVFEGEDSWGIWMKDMLFSIDVIWVDSEGSVVTIVHNVSPDTYPQAFYPTSPARYVLEVPAGYAKAEGIAEGSKIVVE